MRRSRGFTLVELLIALAVAGICIGAAFAAFASQHRTLEALELARRTQGSGRDAMHTLERGVRMAGFGVDPRVAFDLRHYRCTTSPCRDRIDGADELVYVTRSSRYRLDPPGVTCARATGCFVGDAWHVDLADSGSVTLQARTGERFRKGQLLLLSCPGARTYSIGTVSTTTAVQSGDGALRVSFAAAVGGNPYRENNYADPCYSTGLASAFLVERSRWFIDTTSAAVPALMLDTGVDLDLDGRTPDEGDLDDLVTIASGVEDLQVAYVLETYAGRTPPDSNANWVIGDERSRREEPDPTVPGPTYETAAEDARRFTLHPANVRAVRIALGLRSVRGDPAAPSAWAGDPFVLTENRSATVTGTSRLRRAVLHSTVTVRNLSSRALFVF